jgi:hypothetical protein
MATKRREAGLPWGSVSKHFSQSRWAYENFPSPLTQGSSFAPTLGLESAATRALGLCVISQRKHGTMEKYEMSKMRFHAQFG